MIALSLFHQLEVLDFLQAVLAHVLRRPVLLISMQVPSNLHYILLLLQIFILFVRVSLFQESTVVVLQVGKILTHFEDRVSYKIYLGLLLVKVMRQKSVELDVLIFGIVEHLGALLFHNGQLCWLSGFGSRDLLGHWGQDCFR